jgi:hypothetical protein
MCYLNRSIQFVIDISDEPRMNPFVGFMAADGKVVSLGVV